MGKMVRNLLMSGLLGLLAMMLVVQSAEAQDERLAKVTIHALKSLRVEKSDGDLRAILVAHLRSEADADVQLKDVEFTFTVRGNGDGVELGKAHVRDKVIRTTDGPDDLESLVLNLLIGPQEDRTYDRMIKLFNILGDPSVVPEMFLEARGEVGVRVKRGWLYQENVGAELTFKPSIQREVLFK